METSILAAMLTVLGVFIANAALVIPLFLWNRAESRDNMRHIDARLEITRELVYAIHSEVRDFHERLCRIEKEKNK